MISNGSRTASIPAGSTTDGNVKTVLGTIPMEKLQDQDNRYFMLFQIDNIVSTCVCIGIQQEGGDLEKDSFSYRYTF